MGSLLDGSSCSTVPVRRDALVPSIKSPDFATSQLHTSECWPERGNSISSEGVSGDNIDAARPLEITKDFLDSNQLLPDTQRNWPLSKSPSQDMEAMLDRFEGSLPDTQKNILEGEDTLLNSAYRASLQLPDTQRNEPSDVSTNENVENFGKGVLPESQTQVIDRGSELACTVVQQASQHLDTQGTEPNTFADTQTQAIEQPCVFEPSKLLDTQKNDPPGAVIEHLVDGVSGSQSLETQQKTCPLKKHLLSPTSVGFQSQSDEHLSDQDSVLPDTQRAHDKRNATLPGIDPSSQPSWRDKKFIDMVATLVNASVPAVSSEVPSIETGTKFKASQSFTSKEPLNKITCRERKRIVVSTNRPPALTKAMCQWVDKTNFLLDPFRDEDECWFHPSPPPAHLSINGILRPCGKLQKRFNWKDRNGKHSLVLNFGIASKIVNFKMTKQQKDGFINNKWHLSHLCGNWTCLNPAHATVEPGNVNISRNNCFSHRSGCLHNPNCMKDKKVALGADGMLVDLNASVASQFNPADVDDWEDWSILGFDDGEESMNMGDEEELGLIKGQADEDSFIAIDDDDEL